MDKKSWNEEITRRGGSFLQSWEWGELRTHQGHSVERLFDKKNDLAVQLIEHKLPYGITYWYAPKGPLLGSSPKATLEALKDHVRAIKLKSGRISFLRVEPDISDTEEHRTILHSLGFREGISVQPQETIYLDITKSEAELLKEMEHNTRYAMRAALRRGITFVHARTREEKEIAFDEFWKLFEETNTRHKLQVYAKEHYKLVSELQGDCRAEIILAKLNAVTLAAAIVVYFGTNATYLYAGSLAGYSRFNAPTALIWEFIKHAKKEGIKLLDLWGTSATDPRWSGITAFKRSFGGEEIRSVGTWDLKFDNIRYLLYRIYSRLRHG